MAMTSSLAPPPPPGTAAPPPPPQRVTPPKAPAAGGVGDVGGGGLVGNARLTVPKSIVDELLLVCGVIGSRAEDNTGRIVPVTDCLNWLQDLQRALRRDDDAYRPISLLLGGWKVMQQKLLPLVLSCRYDTPLVLTIVKILVILTKPMSDAARRAGRLIIDVNSKKVPDSVIKEQIKLRDNALRQSETLMEYKKLFVHHPSHRPRRSKPSHGDDGGEEQEGGGGLLSIFVSLLADPLSRTGTARTDADHLTIELVLHLFRNLLSAEPIVRGGGSAESAHGAAVLHQELIGLFERELVLDVLLVISQEMESRENAQYNLLIMEILHHLFRGQDPTLVARSVQRRVSPAAGGAKSGARRQQQRPRSSNVRPRVGSATAGAGSLRSHLQMERQKRSASTAARHSHFGGTLVSLRPDGRRQYISAGALSSSNSKGSVAAAPPAPPRRKNRKTEPFIGSGRTSASHARAGATVTHEAGAVTVRAQRSLHDFCSRFVSQCYGPVMKSLKNEFRRDSVRLEEGDKVIFFRIVLFFCQWWRVSRIETEVGGTGTVASGKGKVPAEGKENDLSNKAAAAKSSAVGQLIFTMDVFTYNLVLTSTDTYFTLKKHADLAQTVALYQEMMQLLRAMYHSRDSTEHVMALGLMDRFFYGADPIDRLPKLLSRWTPGTYTREFLCDLVELSHVTLTLLDTNARHCVEGAAAGSDVDGLTRTHSNKTKKKSKRGGDDAQKNDVVARMNAAASEFDFSSYFARKIVSNQVVLMYTRLLSQHGVNAPHINDHIVAFFVRLSKFVISKADDDEGYDDGENALKNEIGVKTSTLEPMLYNVQTLMVLNEILNDATIRDNKDYSSLISFAAVIIRHYARAAEANPMLHVESLFRHPAPHRFCEQSTNMYITEELRMLAEREMLLAEQRKMQEEEADQEMPPAFDGGADGDAAVAAADNSDDDDDDDEDEVEFGDDGNDGITGGDVSEQQAAREKAEKRKKAKAKKKHAREKGDQTDNNGAEDAGAGAEGGNDDGDEDEEEAGAAEGPADESSSLKRKHQDGETPEGEESADTDMEGAASVGPSEVENTEVQAPKATKRIRRAGAILEDSDDDDDQFEVAANVGTNSSRLIWDDEDDEE